MNKDVIYLEPEDDITDILTKLQQAGQKVVAIVPPKKATVLRSAVNMKLVARVAKECDKIAVVVTTDPAIVKMAMTARIPVAKTLQSRPVIPTEENVKAAEADIQVIDEDGEITNAKDTKDSKEAKGTYKTPSKATGAASGAISGQGVDTLDLTEESLENGSEGIKKGKNGQSKAQKSDSDKKVPSLAKYQKWLKIGIPVAVVLVIFLVWAFVFAPSATITVAISSTPSNFSENVKFTTDKNAEKINEGIFYAEKITNEDKFETNFTATGQEDRGEKAKGSLTVSYTLDSSAIKDALGEGVSISVPNNLEFIADNGLSYYSTEAVTIKWDGKIGSDSACRSSSSCKLSATVPVVAANSGASYDVGTSTSWKSSDDRFAAASATAISGGSSKMVTIVTQADVNKAAEGRNSDETSGKTELLSKVKDDQIAIESSYSVDTGDLQPTPAVGSEVTNGTQPKLTAVTIYSIYVVNKSDVETYIKEKTELGDDQRIYSIGKPYFERFTNIEEGARLKTTIETGPTVNEDTIFERAKGRKTGEVQSQLRSINGVSSVEIRTPYFWVWSIPNDRNKVKIELTVDDKDNNSDTKEDKDSKAEGE